MFISHSTILFSLVPALTSAGVLRNLDRREDICGTTGFANSATSYFQSSNGALTTYTGCSSRCAADTRCKSFGYSGRVCMLYESPLSASLAQYAQSDIVYYDATCAGVHGGLAASSSGGGTSESRPFHLHTRTLPWTVTQTLTRSYTTITRTRTMSKVGPVPTGGEIPSLMPFPMPAKSTMLPNGMPNMDNGNKIPRGDSNTGDAVPTSTMVTQVQVTPVPVAQVDRTTLGRSNFPDIDHKQTTFPGPTPTFAAPKASGSARACADDITQPWPAITTTATNKRWFWPWVGFGSPRPNTGDSPNGTIPAGFGGCYLPQQ